MTILRLSRMLAALTVLLLTTPAWGESDSPSIVSTTVEDAVTMASDLLERGEYVEAFTILEPFIKRRPIEIDVYFLFGMAAVAASMDVDLAKETRENSLDIAINAFQTLLTLNPALVRVRLELARAYFLKQEDSLAKEHFERVLAGDIPEPVVANIKQFLAEIRARKSWVTYFGFALAPDSNIGASSGERIIYLYGLPFTLDQEELTSSGSGLSMWGGGEYLYPINERVRLRIGGNGSWREYAGSEFDQISLSSHLGPRWPIGRNSLASVLLVVRHHRKASKPYSNDYGVTTEIEHRYNLRTTSSLRTSWVKRYHHNSAGSNGPIMRVSVSTDHVLTPTVRGDITLGWERERPTTMRERNTSHWVEVGIRKDFAKGLTLNGSVMQRWTNYKGEWTPYTPSGVLREDRLRSYRVGGYYRGFTWRGFSPKLTLAYEERESNGQLLGYKRTFGELSFIRVF